MARHTPRIWTLVTAVDSRTLEQLREVWPTWRRFRPEILRHRLLVLCDAWAGDGDYWRRQLAFVDHPEPELLLWDWPNGRGAGWLDPPTQRERMLAAYVYAARCVATPYYWKVDTDVVATGPGPVAMAAWFRGRPSLVASPWGYTKPGEWIDRLQTWGDRHEVLSAYPRLALPSLAGQLRGGHPRICSWICFINTAFARYAADLAGERLPVPSQDTYHWYVAARLGHAIEKIRFARLGWQSVSSGRARRRLIKEVL